MVSRLESISAAYFGTREIEEDAEEVNSASEDTMYSVAATLKITFIVKSKEM